MCAALQMNSIMLKFSGCHMTDMTDKKPRDQKQSTNRQNTWNDVCCSDKCGKAVTSNIETFSLLIVLAQMMCYVMTLRNFSVRYRPKHHFRWPDNWVCQYVNWALTLMLSLTWRPKDASHRIYDIIHIFFK